MRASGRAREERMARMLAWRADRSWWRRWCGSEAGGWVAVAKRLMAIRWVWGRKGRVTREDVREAMEKGAAERFWKWCEEAARPFLR